MTDFALFNLLAPVLSPLDGLMNETLGLAPLWRIAIWALAASGLSMWLYKVASKQDELEAIKPEIKAVQKKLADPDNEFGSLKGLMALNLKLTGKQLWLSFWPAVVASIPVLFLLAFSSNQFGSIAPEPGTRTYITPVGYQQSPATFEWQGVNAQWDARKLAWTFFWPQTGQKATLLSAGQEQLSLPTNKPAGVIHKKLWWNYLIGNPAGYLDPTASIELFEIDTPEQVIINWGPGWMRGWMFAFFLFLVGFSIAIKVLFKIH